MSDVACPCEVHHTTTLTLYMRQETQCCWNERVPWHSTLHAELQHAWDGQEVK